MKLLWIEVSCGTCGAGSSNSVAFDDSIEDAGIKAHNAVVEQFEEAGPCPGCNTKDVDIKTFEFDTKKESGDESKPKT